ncbi:hypothetical protein [Primorskyibacter sp. 2E233]|uniref:hypothetical protein n=1 Tax=Primorskyibacter sp. 2E233 TaxID=3413431 RepID=UPI003BF10379
MVSSSKILTVSYGTFSCTAEGFEDPLAVVKETTHFFRGVVGEDRFFGAEPPQFDAELAGELMRQQIAAESHDGKLTLRPALAAGAISSGAMAAALSAGPARAASLPDDDTIEAAAAKAEAKAAEAEAQAQAEADAVAADAIAKMSLPDADDTPSEPALTAATVSAPEHAPESDAVADMSFDSSILAGMAADSAANLTEETAPEAGSDFSLDALLPDTAAKSVEPVISAPAPRLTDPASVAAKLDRIRAVVAEAPGAEDEGDDYLEDETLEDSDSSLDAILGTLQADESEDDDLDYVEEVEAPADLSDTIAGLMAGIDDEDADNAEDALSALIDTAEDEAGDDNAFAAWDDDAGEDSPPEESAEADDWDWDDEDEDDIEAAIEAPEVVDQTPPPPPATRPAPLRARVVKVKRAEFDKVVASGQLEEIDDEPEVAAAIPAVPGAETSSLSSEEEDELARELAAVKAELAGDFDDDDWGDDDDIAWDDDEEEVAPVAAPLHAQSKTAQQDWDDEEDAAEAAEAPAPAPLRLAPNKPAAPVESAWDDDDWDDEDDWDDTPAAAEAPAPLRLDNPVAKPRGWGDAPDLDELDARAEQAAISEETEDNIRSAVEGVRKAVKMSSPARAMLTEQKVEDNDTSRILDQTNEELEEPEGNRRRSAIAHLRAAVAATKADKLLGRKSAQVEEEMETYREDLSAVVRPRRPQPGSARTERPADAPVAQRPAPLKLVAEQRVEDEAAAPAEPTAPVRPRRISRERDAEPTPRQVATPTPEAPVSGGDFAAYAENVGASELSDLLEAAAAYMSFVEGRDQFSRPQLMSTVRQAEDSESSREDRLRSFGQLLRDGKIEKTSGGRFTASERISFKPNRAAG